MVVGHCLLCHCIHSIHWFDLFAPKTMSPPPYITIPLCPLHTASTGLTFLHQRTMCPPPYTTIPLYTASTVSTALTFCTKDNVPTTIYHYSTAYCILHPLVSPFCTKYNVPTTIYHFSTVYCIYCILRPLCTASTAYCIPYMPYMAYIGNLLHLQSVPVTCQCYL